VGTACLPDAQRVQLDRLFDELVQARVALAQPTPDLAVCDAVTAVDTRLQGEPGLVDIKPAWPRLREATDALLAVCGQAQLLALPFDSTSATLAGRERWQAGVQRELETACTALQAAARALEKSQPC
jgi:hypothetical protein